MSLEEFADKNAREMEEILVKGNLDAFDETHDPQVVNHNPPFPTSKGSEAYKQSLTKMRQAFTDIRVDWDETIIDGNTIARRLTFHMKHTGEHPAIPVPPTGKEVVMKLAVFLHVKDDKIIEAFHYTDWLGMMQQLGVVLHSG